MTKANSPQQAFEPYRQEARDLETRLLRGEEYSTLPGYHRSGTHVVVCRLQSNPYIVTKLAHLTEAGEPDGEVYYEPDRTARIRAKAAALLRGAGQKGLEQIHSFSEHGPAAINCQYIPDLTMYELQADEARLDAITDEHFAGLIRIYRAMNDRLLQTEGCGANYTYGPNGFTILDYSIQPEYLSLGYQDMNDKILDIAGGEGLITEGDIVPERALRYRSVCTAMLGDQARVTLNDYWARINLTIPRLR